MRNNVPAILFDHYGDSDVLSLGSITVPDPEAGQIRVRVVAASVNPIDIKIRRGYLAAMMPTTFPCVPGMDLAGVVNSVGSGVTDVRVGDDVLGVAVNGSYAHYALVDKYSLKPDRLSWQLAAALPVVGEVAVRTLQQIGAAAGETLLIIGAAGSAGAIAVQLAVRQGIRVIGAANAADGDYITSLGAEAVDYDRDLVDQVLQLAPDGVDAVLDYAGAGSLADAVRLAGGANRVITIADMGAAQFGVTFGGANPADRSANGMAEVAALVADGTISIRIAAALPLTEAKEAQDRVERGRTGGKIILQMPDADLA